MRRRGRRQRDAPEDRKVRPGGGSRVRAPTMIENKKKTPKEWIAERKWREFLGAIPADGKTHNYIVPHPNDLMTIRVTATQIKSDERWYGVEIDLIRKMAKIIVNPKIDGRRKPKKI